MVGESDELILSVIDSFRSPGRTAGIETVIHPETVVDISHESLMWSGFGAIGSRMRLNQLRLPATSETAQLHAQGKAGLYRNPDLQLPSPGRTKTARIKHGRIDIFPGLIGWLFGQGYAGNRLSRGASSPRTY